MRFPTGLSEFDVLSQRQAGTANRWTLAPGLAHSRSTPERRRTHAGAAVVARASLAPSGWQAQMCRAAAGAGVDAGAALAGAGG